MLDLKFASPKTRKKKRQHFRKTATNAYNSGNIEYTSLKQKGKKLPKSKKKRVFGHFLQKSEI